MSRTIFATYVSHDVVGTTVSGNPIVDVTLRDVRGEVGTYRIMHDSADSYGVGNPDRRDVTAYVLTGAGRISHVDDEATSAVRRLRNAFPIGATVATLLLSVSSSGMSRRITVVGMSHYRPGEPHNYSRDVARVLGRKLAGSGNAVIERGAGMDMGFHLVHSLASKLYGDGYALSHRWL